MIVPTSYHGKTIGVFGLARSGLAAVRALEAAGARVWAWDDSESRRLDVGDKAVDLMAVDLAPLDALMLAPGVPLTHPRPHPLVVKAQTAGVPLIADFDLFEAARPALPAHKVVAITGTNGKSTTTALVTHILETAGVPAVMGGNIGTAVMALEPLPEGGVYVIEASSFQLDLARNFTADVGVLLNMAPDHLDRHGDMEGYKAAKGRLFSLQNEAGIAIVSVDDAWSRDIARRASHLLPLSVFETLQAGVSAVGGVLFDHALEAAVASLADMPRLKGVHNHQNAAAAFAVCRALGLAPEVITAGLCSFGGLAHRQENVATIGGISFINDSKATNVDAAMRALMAFRGVHWIAGGRGKGESYVPLFEAMGHVSRAYFIGEAAPDMARDLGALVPHDCPDSLETAVCLAYERAEPGEVVLLSPANTAFDAFANFEARGDAFRQAVAQLGAQNRVEISS